MSKFAFLQKLDLFGNPVAEEPDYRMRLIFHVPQIEILDQHTVKPAERIRAAELVPNLDKVSAKAKIIPKKKEVFSRLQRDIFREARDIAERRRRDEEESFNTGFVRTSLDMKAPATAVFQDNKKRWEKPESRLERELTEPTSWEKNEMRLLIKRIAGKGDLNRKDVEELAIRLCEQGIEEVGRRLGNPSVFAPGDHQDSQRSSVDRCSMDTPPKSLTDDPEALLPVALVTEWLLMLPWPRFDDSVLDVKIERLYDEMKRAELSGDTGSAGVHRHKALMLEGVKTLGHQVNLRPKNQHAVTSWRGDTFPQTFLRPHLEWSGRKTVQAVGQSVVRRLG